MDSAEFTPGPIRVWAILRQPMPCRMQWPKKLIADGSRKPVAGYKMAANSKGAMQHFALTEPAAGRVFGDQVLHVPGGACRRDLPSVRL